MRDQIARFRLVRVLNEKHIGLEGRARVDDHLDTRMWLRLLSCCNQIEQLIRKRLRESYGISLSRFDYLAQLERWPDGMRLSIVSQRLMVTGGNITGLTRELVKEGLVSRTSDADDRRAWLVRLTPKGRGLFKQMAKAHESWLLEMFGELDVSIKTRLYEHLGLLRISLNDSRADRAQ